MKEISLYRVRQRLTYANVVSSLALFLVLGGATAFAASNLGRNSVGTQQLKRNSVTAAKIKRNAVTSTKVKNQSLQGSDIKLSTLGTVPSAASANNLAGRTQFATFTAPGLTTLATFGPFTVKGKCVINDATAEDEEELQLYTSVDNAAMDDNEGDEIIPFNVADSPAVMMSDDVATGIGDIEAGEGEMIAVAPDGSTYGTQNQTVGVNLPGHPGQCFFAATITKIG